MAIRISNEATTKPFASRICFLLLAFIAANSFQGALAAEQPQVDVSNNNNRMLLQRSSSVAEGVDSTNCKDSAEYTYKPRGKPKQKLCDWIGDKPKSRCKKDIVKRKRIKGKKKKKRWIKIVINPKEHCGCKCLDSTALKPTPDVVKICPRYEQGIESSLELEDFSNSGYSDQQRCDYDWIGTGCSSIKYKCLPQVKCTFYAETGRFICSKWDYDGVAYPCATSDPRDPNTLGTLAPIPSGTGKVCTPNDTTVAMESPNPIVQAMESPNPIIEIRRHALLR